MAGEVALSPILVVKKTGTQTAQEIWRGLSKYSLLERLAGQDASHPLAAGTASLKGPGTVALTMPMRLTTMCAAGV